jgi:hypothetical protein
MARLYICELWRLRRMSSLSDRIERSGESILRIARLAGVPARKLYAGESLHFDEVARLEAVLADLGAGRIAPRRGRSAVPA